MLPRVRSTVSAVSGQIHQAIGSQGYQAKYRTPTVQVGLERRFSSAGRIPPMIYGLLLGVTLLSGCNKAAAPAQGMLAIGSKLPDIIGVDQSGKEHQLSANVGHPTLVYFYPKDGTPGCTKEACAFRDVWKRFEQANVTLYGVSRDDRVSHEKFAREHNIPFPLIADTNGSWATAFGVPDKGGKSARVSFLFDSKGQLAHEYPNVDPGVHANQVLSDVSALQ